MNVALNPAPSSLQAVPATLRKSLVVMKFGGTSVQDAAAILRTLAVVKSRRDAGLEPVVIVSAMARVTDQLLATAAAAGRTDKHAALGLSMKLRERHPGGGGQAAGPRDRACAHVDLRQAPHQV